MSGWPKAPYKVGDSVGVLRDEAGKGTVWGPLTLRRITEIDGRRWRLTFIRHDGSAVEYTVGANGRDVNDYVHPRPVILSL